MALFCAKPEPWRHSVFEHFQSDHAVTSVDATKFSAMRMDTLVMVVVVMMVSMVMVSLHLPFAPGPPEHPECDACDDDCRCQLKIGFAGFGIHAPPQVLAAERDHPDNERMREGGGETEHDRLCDGAADRDDEGSHHGLRMAGLQPVKRPEENGSRNEQPRMRRALLEKFGEGCHLRAFLIPVVLCGIGTYPILVKLMPGTQP